MKSILISCGARLAPFDIAELRDLMAEDELELDTLGDRKSALFVILSDTDSTFNFVAALMYSQLFNLLCDKADDFYGGRLPLFGLRIQNRTAACRSMCGACWTSLRILGKFQTSRN